jgi:hypothetical protein
VQSALPEFKPFSLSATVRNSESRQTNLRDCDDVSVTGAAAVDDPLRSPTLRDSNAW